MTPEQKQRAEERMRAYDRLPKTVRKAFAEAAYAWNPLSAYSRWKYKIQNARQIVNSIKSSDASARAERQK